MKITKKKAIKNNNRLFKPNLLFLAGLIFYFFVPALSMQYLPNNVMVKTGLVWMSLEHFNWAYYLDGFIIIASWLLGVYLGVALTKEKKSRFDLLSEGKDYGKYYVVMLAVVSLLFTAYTVASGARFFAFYEDYRGEVLGPYSTLLFTVVFFRNFFNDPKIRLYLLIIVLFCAVILIGLGNRMFTVMALMSVVFDYLSRAKLTRLKIFFALAITAISFSAMVILAAYRTGGQASTEMLLGVLIAEPLYTSMSFNIYLSYFHERPVYSIPFDLFAAFVNFIPTVLFPDKIAFLQKIVYNYDTAPLGATALPFSMYVNFGYFYPLFIVSLAAYFGFLYKKGGKSMFYRAIYLSNLPLLAFFIHREALTTLIKIVVFNALAVPVIAFFITQLIQFLFGKNIKPYNDTAPNEKLA
jgi:hypothetical protein